MLITFPFQSFFIQNLILRTLFVISSQSWFSVWCGLEYNLISFIPILITSPSTKSTESAIKYFVIQAIASIILLLTAIITKIVAISNLHIFIVISLIVKVGVAPFHQWVPNVISAISWFRLFLILTWQKIAPIFILSASTQSSYSTFLVISAGLSSITGGLGGINQTQIRHLIAFSSIGHIGWVLISAIISPLLLFTYFFVYIINLLPLVTLLNSLSVSNFSRARNIILIDKHNASLIFILFFSLGGLPPFLGFAPKLIVIKSILNAFPIVILLILIIGSLINIYYYFSYSVVYLITPNFKASTFPAKTNSNILYFAIIPIFLIPSLLFIV